MDQEQVKKRSAANKLLSGVGILLCAVFGLLLTCNLTIIIKGALYPDRPPSVLGITPMSVLSGSMSGEREGHIEVGDLIFIGKAEPETLKAGDVIAYMQGDTIITHRIVEVQTAEGGTIQWITQGDANNTPDAEAVTAENLVGICRGRIPKLGDYAMFMQQPLGMVIFIGIPVALFIIYDLLERRRMNKRERSKQAQIQEELKRLRELAGESKADGE